MRIVELPNRCSEYFILPGVELSCLPTLKARDLCHVQSSADTFKSGRNLIHIVAARVTRYTSHRLKTCAQESVYMPFLLERKTNF